MNREEFVDAACFAWINSSRTRLANFLYYTLPDTDYIYEDNLVSKAEIVSRICRTWVTTKNSLRNIMNIFLPKQKYPIPYPLSEMDTILPEDFYKTYEKIKSKIGTVDTH